MSYPHAIPSQSVLWHLHCSKGKSLHNCSFTLGSAPSTFCGPCFQTCLPCPCLPVRGVLYVTREHLSTFSFSTRSTLASFHPMSFGACNAIETYTKRSHCNQWYRLHSAANACVKHQKQTENTECPVTHPSLFKAAPKAERLLTTDSLLY